MLAGSPRTTDTMCVILNRFGHVVVDDQRDILDVDTTAGNVCGYQDILGS